MTNDYKKGYRYRVKTDSNFRKRSNGTITPAPDRHGEPRVCHSCKKRSYDPEYHHTPKGGYWLCKGCHGRIHGMKRGKTPRKG